MQDELKKVLFNLNSNGAVAKAIYAEMQSEWSKCNNDWNRVATNSKTIEENIHDVDFTNYIYHRHRYQLLREMYDAIQGV
jgi:hypothetical protein